MRLTISVTTVKTVTDIAGETDETLFLPEAGQSIA
jgi:hypothetical protein